MAVPDLKLMKTFGNEDVYADKLAGRAELVARLALGLIGYGAGRTDLARQQALHSQAVEMNNAFERMQAMKLQQTQANAHHTRVPLIIPSPIPGVSGLGRWDGDDVRPGMDEGMVRLASVAFDVGANMAKEALSIQPLAQAAKDIFGKAGPALGKVMGATAQAPKMPTLAGATQKATGMVQAAPKPPPMVGGFGAKIQQGLQQSGVTSLRGAAMTAGGLALGGMAIKGAVGGVRKGVDVMSHEAGPAQYGTQQFGGSRVPYGINEYGQPDLRTPFM